MSIHALFFDFDGILVSSEPLHYEGFRQVLAQLDVSLSWEEYKQNYMGYGDRDAFRAILTDRSLPHLSDPQTLSHLCTQKAAVVEQLWLELKPLPGVIPFLNRASELFTLVVVSGALRREVITGLERIGVRNLISHIVAAEDVSHGKPHPEGYLKACLAVSLQRMAQGDPPLAPGEGVAFEDTSFGLRAARQAGLYTVGVIGSESADELKPYADLLVSSLEELDPVDLEELPETLNTPSSLVTADASLSSSLRS